jgi:hypothetical protein
MAVASALDEIQSCVRAAIGSRALLVLGRSGREAGAPGFVEKEHCHQPPVAVERREPARATMALAQPQKREPRMASAR